VVNAYIDGAHLRHRSSVALKQLWDVDPEFDFAAIRRVLGAGRLFYYDCVEHAPRQGESQEHFESRVERQRALLASVLNANMCHVRTGTLKPRQKSREVTQKEVDVQLAVDMLTHAASSKMERAVLLTGDLDFRPAVESLVQSGVIVELCFDPLVTAIELREAADIRRELRIEDWYNFCSEGFRAQYELPRSWVGNPGIDRSALLRTGKYGESALVRLWNSQSAGFVVDVEPVGRPPWCSASRDRDLLIDRFLPLKYPGIEWDRPA
jgi:uncharacterized LabA/DUF88 family protein